MRFWVLFLLLCGCVSKTDYFGHSFLGTKYLNSPLGEGMLPDTDPLIRFDAFDCTTFVETVLANGDVKKLNKIRYKDGKVDFLNRNHFIETDWVHNNKNLVENVSKNYGNTVIKTIQIDKQNWFKTVHKIDADFETEMVMLEYIPYQNINRLDLRRPVVVLFVADNQKIRDKIGTDIGVVHMGFLLPDGKLRHASSEKNMVVDVDFYEYIKQRQQTQTNLGIVLLDIKK